MIANISLLEVVFKTSRQPFGYRRILLDTRIYNTYTRYDFFPIAELLLDLHMLAI